MKPSIALAVSPHSATELNVETVSDYQSFLQLEPVWNRLLDETETDQPFLRHEWMRTWWECFGAGKELRILVVKSGEEVIAIAPLMLSRGWMYGFKVHRLESIHNDHTPRFDFIIGRWVEQAYRAIWSSLLQQREPWDVLQLSDLAAGSRTLDQLQKLAAEDGFLVGLWRSVDSPYVPFIGGWESYFQPLSRNHRRKVRKGLKRLSCLGEVGLEVVSSDEALDSALEEGLRIEAAAWKGKAGTAIRGRPELYRFYNVLAHRAAHTGMLALLFLTVDHSRIAFAYALSSKNKLYVLKAGYDPRYAHYSPYNLLCYLVFRDGFERGLAEYEFLGGNEEWKLKWTQKTKPHYCLFIFPDVLRMRLLYYAKFRLISRLQQYRVYRFLRDAMVARRNDFL